VGLLVAVLLTLSCSPSTTVRGQLSTTSTGGGAVSEADVEVMLLEVTEAFESEWARTAAAFASERARAQLAADEAEIARNRTSADRSAASAAWLSVLLQRDDVDWSAYDRAAERQKAAVDPLLQAAHQRRVALSRLVDIARRYCQEAWGLVQSSQSYRARTDASGRFEFAGVTAARYILAAQVRLGEGEVHWFIRGSPGPNAPLTVDLTPANAGWPFS
jgi:hypothetical protein